MLKDVCLNKNYIELWENDLATLKHGEEIRIISGEISWQLAKKLSVLLIKYINDFKISIKMIAGPVISVEDDTRSNAILDLAEKGIIKLWISPFRQLSHYRIFGRRFMYKENYHTPLSEERCGQYIYDGYIISKYIFDFENLIDSLNMKLLQDKISIIKKTNKEIKELQKKLGENYDFLLADQVAC